MPIEGWVMPLSQREMNEISIPERYANSSCVSPSSTRRRFSCSPKILAVLDVFIWRGMDSIVQVFPCAVQSIYALIVMALKTLRSEGRGPLTSRGGHDYGVCTDKTRVLPAEFRPGPPSEL